MLLFRLPSTRSIFKVIVSPFVQHAQVCKALAVHVIWQKKRKKKNQDFLSSEYLYFLTPSQSKAKMGELGGDCSNVCQTYSIFCGVRYGKNTKAHCENQDVTLEPPCQSHNCCGLDVAYELAEKKQQRNSTGFMLLSSVYPGCSNCFLGFSHIKQSYTLTVETSFRRKDHLSLSRKELILQ